MLAKFVASFRSFSLSKIAAIVNWVCFVPVLAAGLIGYFSDDESALLHWIPLSALAILGFAYALLLSADSQGELFRDRPLFNNLPRWLWRWICAGWGFLMVALIYVLHINPLVDLGF